MRENVYNCICVYLVWEDGNGGGGGNMVDIETMGEEEEKNKETKDSVYYVEVRIVHVTERERGRGS